MSDPATALTHHDEDHDHYTDRPDLEDRLTRVLHTTLVDLWQPDMGHSATGDVRALEDDARTLAEAALAQIGVALDERWEAGRKHGVRQVHRPGRARVKELEAEIEAMLTLEEGNSRAFHNRCERVRELEAENTQLHEALARARQLAGE